MKTGATLDPAGAAVPEAGPTLFGHLRQRPGLLGLELLWRWSTGGLLLLLGGFEAWRIWVAALPQLHRIGVLDLSATLILEDPSHVLRMLSESVDLLQPPVERAAWGLGPLMIFVWVAAYAVGRSAVLARFDPRLPRRPWLLAESEALRVVGRLITAGVWGAVAEAAAGRIAHDQPAWSLVLLLGGLSVAILLLSGPATRTSHFATLLALVEGRSLTGVWRRAWVYGRSDVVKPLRDAVKRVRQLLLLLALVLALVPDPFPFGPWLMAWWVLLGLPSLAAADAWKLGGVLAVLGTLEVVESGAGRSRVKP